MTERADWAVLACYAHPDDEQGITGFLRRCVEQGIRVGILCATRGEVGQIADPALATPETLGAVREREMRRAADVIGVQDVFFLDYRDSGMAGTDENTDPRAFVNADPQEAVGRIVRVMRAFKPTLIITFDESGGYGHPDHLAICRWTTEAFHAAADPEQYPREGAAFAPSRLYYASFGRGVIRQFAEFLAQNNIPSPFPGVDVEQMGLADERITHTIYVSEYLDLKRRSLEEHRTQMFPNTALNALPAEMWNAFRSVERFALVAGVPLPEGAPEDDLFAGL
jgi:LmbE family N-acetylglucosaminyl deacetylase